MELSKSNNTYYFLRQPTNPPTETQNYFPQEHGRTAHPWFLCATGEWPLDLVHAAIQSWSKPWSSVEVVINDACSKREINY
jgi:hypothetical protein